MRVAATSSTYDQPVATDHLRAASFSLSPWKRVGVPTFRAPNARYRLRPGALPASGAVLTLFIEGVGRVREAADPSTYSTPRASRLAVPPLFPRPVGEG